MPRPVILFTQQWTDLPLEELVQKASEWGYQGLELACWGDHFEVQRALSEEGYCQRKLELLARADLSYEEPVNELLDSYCEFLKSPKGYVVQELLRKAIVKDRDFQTSRGNVKNVKTRKPRGRKRLLDDERKSESEIEAVA